MKLIRTAVMAALTLGLGFGIAQAAVKSSAPAEKKVMQTSNVYGRPGLIFADTARVTGAGKINMSLHGIFGAGDYYSTLNVPFGLSFGVSKNIELDGTADLLMVSPDGGDSEIGLGFIKAGVKFGIPGKPGKSPDVAVGGLLRFGLISDNLRFGDSGMDLDIYGVCSYTIPSGLLLNGQFGIMILDGRGGEGDTDIHLNVGMGVPFSPTLTGLFELAMNEEYDGNSSINGGLLIGRKAKAKVFAGIGIDDGPDFLVGGGITF